MNFSQRLESKLFSSSINFNSAEYKLNAVINIYVNLTELSVGWAARQYYFIYHIYLLIYDRLLNQQNNLFNKISWNKLFFQVAKMTDILIESTGKFVESGILITYKLFC